MLIKFITCVYAIVVMMIITGCSVKKDETGQQHGDASQELPEEKSQPGYTPGPIKTIDLSGVLQNTFEIFSYSRQEGLWRLGSSTFQIQIPGPGTFIILSAGINSKTCNPDQARSTFALFDMDNSGVLTRMRPIETQLPFVFYKAQTLLLQVDSAVKAHCTSLSPAEVFIVTKYITQDPDSLPTNPDLSGSDPDQNQPQLPANPALPSEPTRPIPSPVCDGKPWPTDLAAVFKGKIRLWSTPSLNDGCQNTFTWSIAENARLDPLNGCAAPTIAIEQPQDQFLKINESFSTGRMQLAWLLLQSTASATNIKERLYKGETIDLTYEGDSCISGTQTSDVPRNLVKLVSPTDLLLFRGDSRESGLDKACGIPVIQTLEPIRSETGKNQILATYDYKENTATSFFYKLDFNFAHATGEEATTWKVALFNRKTHGWIYDWTTVDGPNAFKNSFKLTDPDALRRLLPHQEHIELVFRPKAVCKAGETFVQKIFDLGGLFAGAGGEKHFHDLKYPEQSRFLLSEDDYQTEELKKKSTSEIQSKTCPQCGHDSELGEDAGIFTHFLVKGANS
jgi:hypothetical protein